MVKRGHILGHTADMRGCFMKWPLDKSLIFWELGRRDSNPDKQIQSLRSYRWTTSQTEHRKDSRRAQALSRALSKDGSGSQPSRSGEKVSRDGGGVFSPF